MADEGREGDRRKQVRAEFSPILAAAPPLTCYCIFGYQLCGIGFEGFSFGKEGVDVRPIFTRQWHSFISCHYTFRFVSF